MRHEPGKGGGWIGDIVDAEIVESSPVLRRAIEDLISRRETLENEVSALAKWKDEIKSKESDLNRKDLELRDKYLITTKLLREMAPRLEEERIKLQAIINGLKTVLKNADQYGVVRDGDSRSRFEAEIQANERDLAGYRQRIREYREAIDLGRAQIGFGDQRFVDDDDVRRRFRQVFNREVSLVASGGAGADYAQSIQGLLRRADGAEDSLERTKSGFDEQIRGKASEVRAVVAKESQAIEEYAAQLGADPERWLFLTGPLERVRAVSFESFLLPFERDEAQPVGQIVTHRTVLTVVDGDGAIRGYYEGETADGVEQALARARFLAGRP